MAPPLPPLANTPSPKVAPFPASKAPALLSWIDSERTRRLWSGNTFEKIPSPGEFMNHLSRTNLHPYAGLDEEDELVAYGELVDDKGKAGILCRVIVNPDKRRQGFGKAFCRELLQIGFRKLGYRHVTLNAFHFNLPALRCYESLGFRRIAFRPKARNFQNEASDLVIMRKDRPLLRL